MSKRSHVGCDGIGCCAFTGSALVRFSDSQIRVSRYGIKVRMAALMCLMLPFLFVIKIKHIDEVEIWKN